MIGLTLSDRYEVVREIGRGGMGVVYLARDRLLEREVAIKMLSPSALNEQTEARFRVEAKTVAGLDHPSIVSLYNLGEHDGSLFLVMPFVHGSNLREFLKGGPMRDQADVAAIGLQIAEALEHSHARGVIHRDIKPENVIVSRDGESLRIRLSDFGIALVLEGPRHTRTGSLLGTVGYLAPEQVDRGVIDGRTDLYGAGNVLYECLAGRPPFTHEFPGILYEIVHNEPPPLRSLRPDIDEELESVVMKCLEKDRVRRPRSARDLATVLGRIHKRLAGYGASSAPDTGRGAAASSTPFVGRHEELAKLLERFDKACEGECQLVLISGEAGSGKSRLIEALRSETRARGAIAVIGRFHETEHGIPFQGFGEAIQEAFLHYDDVLEGTFADLATPLTTLFPFLAEAEKLRIPLNPSEAPAALSGDDRNQIFELLARTFVRIAGSRVLVLVLEDLQTADVSAGALIYLSRRLRATPTLIVGTYRIPEVSRGHPLMRVFDVFSSEKNFEPFRIDPLTVSEIADLERKLLPPAERSRALAEAVHAATDGNAFFVVEMLRGIAAGAVSADDLVARLGEITDPRTASLPATIRQAIERRIEKLPEEARRVLSTLSILGRSFDLASLEAVTGNPPDEAVIANLVNAGLLREEHRPRGDHYAFTNVLVRDALYTSIPRRKRRGVHEQYALYLERRYAGKLDRIYPELLDHYAQADIADKVVYFGLRLARKCLAAFGAEDAVQVARVVLDFLDDEDPEQRPFAGKARRLLGEAQRMLGNPDAALEEIREAARLLAGEGEDFVRLCSLGAEIAWERRLSDEARRWIERGLAEADGSTDPEPVRRLLVLGETIANLRGDSETARAFHERLDVLHRVTATVAVTGSGGVLHVPLTGVIVDLDPALAFTLAQNEVIPVIYDTLTRESQGARVVPWLAERVEAVDGGSAYRVTLRDDIRFHDGRPLRAEDVRGSFVRLLRNRSSEMRHLLTPIRGAEAVMNGDAESLEGFRHEAGRTFVVELERPVAFFPALMTISAASIAPEETVAFRGTWHQGVVGTGPFRIARFDPGHTLELEPNPHYWRSGLPKCDGIIFHFGVAPDAIRDGFRSGQYSTAFDLFPDDVRRLRSEPAFTLNYRETPRLSTYYVALNSRAGPLRDLALRKSVRSAIAVDSLVSETVGRQGIPARGFIPPGLLGHDPIQYREPTGETSAEYTNTKVRLRAMLNSAYDGPYADLARTMFTNLSNIGLEIEIIDSRSEYFANQAEALASADLVLTRWIADFPDAHDFVSLLHSGRGLLGRMCGHPEIDLLIEQEATELNPDARHVICRRIETRIREEVLLVPLFHEQACRFARPEVAGFDLSFAAPLVAYERMWKRG